MIIVTPQQRVQSHKLVTDANQQRTQTITQPVHGQLRLLIHSQCVWWETASGCNNYHMKNVQLYV